LRRLVLVGHFLVALAEASIVPVPTPVSHCCRVQAFA
jgi:hypothetical protein